MRNFRIDLKSRKKQMKKDRNSSNPLHTVLELEFVFAVVDDDDVIFMLPF